MADSVASLYVVLEFVLALIKTNHHFELTHHLLGP